MTTDREEARREAVEILHAHLSEYPSGLLEWVPTKRQLTMALAALEARPDLLIQLGGEQVGQMHPVFRQRVSEGETGTNEEGPRC